MFQWSLVRNKKCGSRGLAASAVGTASAWTQDPRSSGVLQRCLDGVAEQLAVPVAWGHCVMTYPITAGWIPRV